MKQCILFLIIYHERKKERNNMRWNLAADAAINQYIENLHDSCIYPETLGEEKGKYVEYYYETIMPLKSKTAIQ